MGQFGLSLCITVSVQINKMFGCCCVLSVQPLLVFRIYIRKTYIDRSPKPQIVPILILLKMRAFSPNLHKMHAFSWKCKKMHTFSSNLHKMCAFSWKCKKMHAFSSNLHKMHAFSWKCKKMCAFSSNLHKMRAFSWKCKKMHAFSTKDLTQ